MISYVNFKDLEMNLS